ncbi:MAG: cobalt ECF transporter T component CbiQ [Desulfobacteraceae bacterium]|nr:MAG: cobalt ECF transporter T component CbiQ [Desulfobacteraceae bacterium]
MKIEFTHLDLGAMEAISNLDTPLHRLDPRAKVVTTLVFITCVVSFGRYEVSALMPFFLYPFILLAVGNLPVSYIAKRVLLVSPFAVLIGIFNPVLDTEVLIRIGSLPISGGWISFISIIIRVLLTVGAALILIAATGFNSVCMALERMGVPRVFVMQLLFLYRYLFVLADEASRMMRARSLRSFQGKGMGIRVFGSMAGNLLLRTLDRAQRIHLSMLCRGFDGNIRLLKRMKLGWREAVFVLGWSAVFLFMRMIPLPRILGQGFMS